MATPIRVLIPIDSQESEALRLALGYAQEICKKAASRDVLLVTHTKDQLRHTPLADHLGTNASKALLAGRSVPLPSGAALRHGTVATLRYFSGKAATIAYYANETLLEFVDGMNGLAGVVAVPWVPGEADQWRERWTPIVHGEGKQEPAPILDDPIIEAGLLAVSNIINLSHSLLQSRDKQWVDETLRILRAKGHALDAAKIKNWAIRHSWKPGAADELAKLARKIGEMKTKPRLAAIHNADGRYARWKAADS